MAAGGGSAEHAERSGNENERLGAAFLARARRSLNSLRDADMNLRREALDALYKLIAEEASEEALGEAARDLTTAISSSLLDPSEKCRERAVAGLRELARRASGEGAAEAISEASAETIGKCCEREPSEEIRLQCAKLASLLVDQGQGKATEELSGVAKRLMQDPYPEASKEGARLGAKLAPTAGESKQSLAQEAVKMAWHKHAQARMDALDCLDSVVRAEMEEPSSADSQWLERGINDVARRVPKDRAAKARAHGYRKLGQWLELGVGDAACLIESLLKGAGEDAEETRGEAEGALATNGVQSRVGEVAGAVGKSLASHISGWAREQREEAARALVPYAMLFKKFASEAADELLPALQRLLASGSSVLAKAASECAMCLGEALPAEALLLPDLLEPSLSSPTSSAASLSLLCSLLHGCSTLPSDTFSRLAESLANSHFRSDELRPYLTSALIASIKAAEEIPPSTGKALLPVALHLNEAGVDGAQAILDNLPHPFEHAREMISSLREECSSWDSAAAPGFFVLGGLLRFLTPESLQGMLDDVMTIYEDCLEEEREAHLRIDLLRQLDSLVEDDDKGPLFVERGPWIVECLLLPNMKWKAGRAAAQVRYQAVVALGTLLRRDAARVGGALREYDGGLQYVLSCLEEEHSVDTRKAACYALECFLLGQGRDLTDEERRSIYPALLRRMDDARSELRLSAAATIGTFLRTIPASYCDTNARYLMEGFIVHMDDPDAKLRSAVCRALEEAAQAKPSLLRAVCSSARQKHRSADLCDHLIHICDGSTDTGCVHLLFAPFLFRGRGHCGGSRDERESTDLFLWGVSISHADQYNAVHHYLTALGTVANGCAGSMCLGEDWVSSHQTLPNFRCQERRTPALLHKELLSNERVRSFPAYSLLIRAHTNSPPRR